MENITFCMTSCGRFDLLKQTLNSFLEHNEYHINKYLIVDDSGDSECHKNIRNMYPFVELIINETQIGQIKSIDRMYERVDTDYIFHCEDDWLFTNGGFIEKSLKILKNNSKIFQVWIRDKNDHNHPLLETIYTIDDIKYSELLPLWGGIYSGFTFNPSLIRYRDYKTIGKYYNIGGETKIGHYYLKMGFKFYSLLEGYCRHNGQNRHIEDIDVINNRKFYYDF